MHCLCFNLSSSNRWTNYKLTGYSARLLSTTHVVKYGRSMHARIIYFGAHCEQCNICKRATQVMS